MKNIKLIILIIFVVFVNKLEAQQDPMFSQYMFNTLSLNPAYAGSAKLISATAITRHQWMGIDGAPQTQTFVIHAPLKHQLGGGISILRDQAGPVNNLSAQANISYHVNITQKTRLFFGLMGGVNSLSVRLTELQNVGFEDVSFSQNIQTYKPVFGFGVYLSNPKGYLGISAPNLIETNYNTSPSAFLQHKRHYFLIAGYIQDLNKNVKFRPSIMFRYVNNAPLSAEVTANFILKDLIWLGAMYRFQDAAGALFGFQITPQLRFGYSYDYSLNALRGNQNGSHELMINYDFSFKPMKYVSPRYF